MEEVIELAPKYASFFGLAGIPIAVGVSAYGAAYGTAKAGIAITACAQFRPELTMKSLIPVVMAGIIAIYGLVISVMTVTDLQKPDADNHYTLFQAACHLSAGIACGGASASAGYAIGVVGDAGVRAYMQQPRMFVGMVLMLIFGEVLGLYGMIAGLIILTKAKGG